MTKLSLSALLGATMLAGLPTAYAQDTIPAAQDAGAAVDEIVVTGSRIARDPNEAAPVPVQSIDSEAIKLSGSTDLGEVLREIPALTTSTSLEGSEDGVFSPSTGAQVLNLRGLGSERTLVLVDGRRHVSGVAGEQSVDIGSIPQPLIQRVEVLTGGASALYGADAVTGVVNFVMNRDFDGVELDLSGGMGTGFDAGYANASVVAGKNFADDRANVTLAVEYDFREALFYGDRAFSANNGLADDYPNPFDTPFTRAIAPNPRFSISSAGGVVAPIDFGPANTDIDGNGVPDCQQSTVGQNWVDFGFGGCFVIDPDGTVRPYEDGIVATAFNQFGGDGIPNTFNEDTLIPESDKLAFNLFADYDLTDSLNVFVEAKYVEQSIEFGGPLNTFYDLLTVTPENPFIPDVLQPVADAAGGLYITRDPADLGPNYSQNDRETYRIVAGLRGELENGWNWEVSGNYGRFEQENLDRNAVIQDRWFAAIDVIADENGNPICRSDVDDTPPPTTPFDIPAFTPGFYTFNPGDGSCAPANILGGRGAISQEAIDFITTTTVSEFELEQFVVSAFLTGDTAEFFELPGGAVGFAVGAEYRDEDSTSTFDPLVRGVVPVTTAFAQAGDLVSEDEDTLQNSLVFDPSSLIQNSGGGYDVYDLFAEVSVPLLADLPLIADLTVDGAVRYSDYSTIGETFTWKVGGAYSPIDGIRFRAVYSEAVRAPNIDELFSPEQGAVFRPDDPCDVTEINAIQDPALRAVRASNCQADGLPADFRDPLTARFSGVTSGNPDLQEETAETITVGVVFSDILPGLTLSADYWQIEIDEAIASPSAQDVVDNCYDAADFPNQFCGQFTRNRNEDSPQFGGFNFLRLQELNFAAIEARGLDLAGAFRFDAGPGEVSLTGNATYTDDLDFFFDPISPDVFDPEQRELQRPDWAGNVGAAYAVNDWQFVYNMHFESEQGLRSVEIEEEIDPGITPTFGPTGFADPIQIHDLAFNYAAGEMITVYGGINNLTDENPFITEAAYPVSPRGRTLFMGVTIRH